MARVTTGYQTTIGEARTSRAHELLRMAYHAHAELVNDPVADGLDPITIEIIRKRKTANGSTSAGIPATWMTVAGLTAIPGTVHFPESWNARRDDSEVTLHDNQRIVSLVDVPATLTEAADVVLLSDRLVFDDPTYGADSVWRVKEVRSTIAGAVRVVVEYAHTDESA